MPEETLTTTTATDAAPSHAPAPAAPPVRVDPTTRRPKTLYVFANPWHGPLDHNHRANTAVPWDPDNHNGVTRGFVGAVHRLDPEGELYFEFEQFDHELDLMPDAQPIPLPEFGKAGRSAHYLQALRDGSILPADPQTHKAAWGTDKNYVDVAQRVAWAKAGRLQQHARDHEEPYEPKARPKKGEGRIGPSHAARALSAVQPASGVGAAKTAIDQLKAESAKKGVA